MPSAKTTRPVAAFTIPAIRWPMASYVTHSNVSAVDEMVNMISASRSLSEQRGSHEHGQDAAAQDFANGPVSRGLNDLRRKQRGRNYCQHHQQYQKLGHRSQ
ncbi:hypothetical protein J4711_14975 [Staphylococcus epidermidis]|nr:hypothetical protein [Staphylococcus epidermidis]